MNMKLITRVSNITAILLFVACSTCQASSKVDKILKAFNDAEFEAEDSFKMSPRNYGMAPYVCDGYRFYIPSLGNNAGGRLFVCNNKKDQQLLANFYRDLGRKSAALFSWVFEKGNVILQMNGEMDEPMAMEYKEIFMAQ